MALSRSVQKGQVPKYCDLCETDSKIQWKCINCNLLMCTRCKENVHSKFQSANKHTTIGIKEVGKHSEELDLSNINCPDHERQTCFMFCMSCDQLVCPKCIAEVHIGHRFVQISEWYKTQIENLKVKQKQIKSLIEELTSGESKIKLLQEQENLKYTKTRNLIKDQNAALKMEVDKHTDKLINELDQKWETLKKSIKKEEHRVTTMKMQHVDQNTQANDIINSNNADRVFKESKQIEKFIIESVEPSKLDFTTMPIFVPGEITECNLGTLQDIPKDLVLNIHQKFTSDIDRVYFLSSCPDNSLWISDQNVIQRVKQEGNSLKVMSKCNLNMVICGMALTPSNDILLFTKGSSRLKQISGSSGQVTDSVYSVDSLIITAIHVTSDYKVMVGARTTGPLYPVTGRRVVIRMNQEGKQEKTYEHDRNKQAVFSYVGKITSTTNGTIFVVDKLSEVGRGRVVVNGEDGEVLHTYTGHPSVNSEEKPFIPVFVLTTPLDNIIITDKNTRTLHILNCVGHLITYYNTNNIGILYPHSLSFTSSGQLYIGCNTPLHSKDKAEVYKLNVSQI